MQALVWTFYWFFYYFLYQVFEDCFFLLHWFSTTDKFSKKLFCHFCYFKIKGLQCTLFNITLVNNGNLSTCKLFVNILKWTNQIEPTMYSFCTAQQLLHQFKSQCKTTFKNCSMKKHIERNWQNNGVISMADMIVSFSCCTIFFCYCHTLFFIRI